MFATYELVVDKVLRLEEEPPEVTGVKRHDFTRPESNCSVEETESETTLQISGF